MSALLAVPFWLVLAIAAGVLVYLATIVPVVRYVRRRKMAGLRKRIAEEQAAMRAEIAAGSGDGQ